MTTADNLRGSFGGVVVSALGRGSEGWSDMPADELFSETHWPVAIVEEGHDEIESAREQFHEGVLVTMSPFTRTNMIEMHAVMFEL